MSSAAFSLGEKVVNSELATEIKKLVQTLRPWTNLNLKVVERGGHKLQDMLCKSNPWDSTACDRVDCFTCNSSIKCEKQNFKSCYKRSIVYETWCYTCLKHHGNMSEHDEDQDNEVYVGAWLDLVEQEIISKKTSLYYGSSEIQSGFK